MFQSIHTTIISNIQKSLGKGSGWIIDSVFSILKYNPLAENSYIKLPKELDHPRTGSINVQNIDDNECFKWSLVKYLYPADCNPARITKADKDFVKKLDFRGIKFPVKISDIHKIEKKKFICSSVFGYENLQKHPIYVSKNVKKNIDLSLGEEGKRHCVLIKDFNMFMYDYTLHRGRKHFYSYCLQAFSTEEILKRQIKDCLKINGKQIIVMHKKGKYVKFKNDERKIKSLFIAYAYFESILVPEDPKDSYKNKCEKHIACNYGHKLVSIDYKFSKPSKAYSGKNAVYSLINNMIEEGKYCTDPMKKKF